MRRQLQSICLVLLLLGGCGHSSPDKPLARTEDATIRLQTQGAETQPSIPSDLIKRVAPNALVLDGTNVFADGARTHEILKDAFVVVKMQGERKAGEGVFHGQFGASRLIEWWPVRSSRPPEYSFKGTWEFDNKGTLRIHGKYVQSPDAGPFAGHMPEDSAYLVSYLLLRKGYPPYKHTLELWLEPRGR